ncbi:MAG: hypothetical protein GEU94_14415 [Micromonosporaceae bacterium]|nr:hypothetical protein [Micromonosporaceae bacterium]
MTSPRRALHALLGALILATALVAAAHADHTRCAHAVVGVRQTVCAETLSVRTQPGGAWMGTLYHGQTFDVEQISPSGAWVYGFAYGHINRRGWVQNGWFYRP